MPRPQDVGLQEGWVLGGVGWLDSAAHFFLLGWLVLHCHCGDLPRSGPRCTTERQRQKLGSQLGKRYNRTDLLRPGGQYSKQITSTLLGDELTRLLTRGRLGSGGMYMSTIENIDLLSLFNVRNLLSSMFDILLYVDHQHCLDLFCYT